MKRNAFVAILVLGVACAASSAWANGGDAAAGQSLFTARCEACHGLNPTRKPGPPLAGVYGRRAGSVASYHYSAALMAAPVTWNDVTLDHWLRSPLAFIPSANMQAHVDSEQERQNLIAYLKSMSAAAAAQKSASSDRDETNRSAARGAKQLRRIAARTTAPRQSELAGHPGVGGDELVR
jgi:cytochrome c